MAGAKSARYVALRDALTTLLCALDSEQEGCFQEDGGCIAGCLTNGKRFLHAMGCPIVHARDILDDADIAAEGILQELRRNMGNEDREALLIRALTNISIILFPDGNNEGCRNCAHASSIADDAIRGNNLARKKASDFP